MACRDAAAQEKLRVGKAVAESFAFVPLDVGVRQGTFKRHGLDIEITAFGGGARLQQALAAESIDMGVSVIQARSHCAGAPRDARPLSAVPH